MKFKEYLQKVNEDANYNPEVFEDEVTGNIPEVGNTDVADPTPVEQKSAMGDLIERYFSKGENDAIKSLDGFSNDFVNELSAYISKEWVNPEDFTGRDDALVQFKKKVEAVLDGRINKIGTAIHDLGVQLANTKNLFLKK
jgi:hypothetical protein